MGMDRRSASSWLLVLSTLAAVAVVPDWPHRHLSDPSYWAVGGFLVLVGILFGSRGDSWSPGGTNRRTVLTFLILVPVVYVADWLRFGGSPLELGIEVAGLGLWGFLAVTARRSDIALWLGCVLHGVWDAAHFGRVGFVPEWYAAGCMAADIGLGGFVFIRLKDVSPQ
jgi:hypothetical protein